MGCYSKTEAVLAAVVLSFASSAVAHAEQTPADSTDADKVEHVDGAGRCRELVQRNIKGRRFAQAMDTPTGSEDVDDGSLTAQFWRRPALLWATVLPHLNVAMRDANPEPGVSFPWSLPFGPSMSCSRERGSFDVGQHYPLRLLLEPGILLGDRSVAVLVRPGVRYVYHPSDWVVGVGGGFGPLFEFAAKNEPGARVALSPEALIQLGTCCQPGYVTLAFRREIFLAGKSQVWLATVGFTYF